MKIRDRAAAGGRARMVASLSIVAWISNWGPGGGAWAQATNSPPESIWSRMSFAQAQDYSGYDAINVVVTTGQPQSGVNLRLWLQTADGSWYQSAEQVSLGQSVTTGQVALANLSAVRAGSPALDLTQVRRLALGRPDAPGGGTVVFGVGGAAAISTDPPQTNDISWFAPSGPAGSGDSGGTNGWGSGTTGSLNDCFCTCNNCSWWTNALSVTVEIEGDPDCYGNACGAHKIFTMDVPLNGNPGHWAGDTDAPFPGDPYGMHFVINIDCNGDGRWGITAYKMWYVDYGCYGTELMVALCGPPDALLELDCGVNGHPVGTINSSLTFATSCYGWQLNQPDCGSITITINP